jgi:hypothetical protein
MKRKDNFSFIKECKKIHIDKYDYSLVNYINNKTKVKIICPEHGVFEQCKNHNFIFEVRPDIFLQNRTLCPKCKNFIFDNETFIKKSKIIHGDKYDYSLVNYINTETKVKIICQKHGEFQQTPHNHLNGNSCPSCVKNKKLSTNDFIEKSKKIHNDKYDYSLVNYINYKTKVKIICPEHGLFEQKSDIHLSGCGCSKCNESKGEKKIRIFLLENNIKFVEQKKYSLCKNKKSLPFDFYLPIYNLCIEYDGIQHYIIKKFFGGKEGFEKLKKNEKIKNSFCEKNNINLLRISYKDYDNIENIIKNKLHNYEIK